MDLKIYQQENKLRKNYKLITDDALIKWDNVCNMNSINVDDENVIMKGDNKKFVEKQEFNKRFFNSTGGLLSYLNWDNIVVAGGCINNCINESVNIKKNISDTDIFLYGLTEEEGKNKIKDIINSVKSYCEDHLESKLHILKNKYVISLVPKKINKRCYKIQIIIRLYKCIYEILAGFDIDSSAIAYNGVNVLLTPRSLNSFLTKLNVIDLTRRSPSYESRLYKYHKRGFGIYIPFKFENNNKVYFLNSKSMGIDKLMYLLKYKKTRNFNKFLNIITQRINKRLKFNNVTDYEGDDLTFNEGDIRNDIIKYNENVDEDFKYKLYNQYSNVTSNLKFIIHDPGQQLTGSFNPITDQDWINIDYSIKGIDFIGRDLNLVLIKNNVKVDMGILKGKNIYDNSLFNSFHYMIMYYENDDDLIKSWQLVNMLCKDKNLYKISYIEMAILLNRIDFVKYCLELDAEIKEYKYNFSILLEICFVMDNIDMLLLLLNYYSRYNNTNSYNINLYQSTLKKYYCTNIASHFCIKIDNYQRSSNIQKIKDMDKIERCTYLYNLWYNWGYFYQKVELEGIYNIIDYFNLTIEEISMINYLEYKNKRVLRTQCIKDIKKQIEYEQIYEKGTFEYVWSNYIYKKIINKQNNKSDERHNFATVLIKELFNMESEEMDKLYKLKLKNPIRDINPFVFNIMKNIYENNFDSLKDYKKLYRKKDEYKPLEEFIVYIDDIEIAKKVMGNHLNEFIKTTELDLKENLKKYLKELEEKQIELSKDNIFYKYRKSMLNTPDHIKIFQDGILDKNYIRAENIFGFTPCDYVINKLLYFYNTTINNMNILEDDMLKLLCNLRKSLHNIDRKQKIISIERKYCQNSEIEEILNKI